MVKQLLMNNPWHGEKPVAWCYSSPGTSDLERATAVELWRQPIRTGCSMADSVKWVPGP